MKDQSFKRNVGFAWILFLSGCLFFWVSEVRGQSQSIGYWQPFTEEAPRIDWQAKWIWTDESLPTDVLLARRKFQLAQIPKEARLLISASSQYQVFINGQYLRRGPARSAPHHQYFDLLDLRDYLKKGENCLAVRVHHQKNKRSYHLNGRAGLLAQLELSDGNTTKVIPTNREWKVTSDPSWDNSAPLISRFQMVVNDRMDLRKGIPNWNAIEFNDEQWAMATALMRNVGWPSPPRGAKPQTLTPPWTSLRARDLPYLREGKERATKLIEAKKIKHINAIPLERQIEASFQQQLKNDQTEKESLTIPVCDSSYGYFLLFDFGQVRNGFGQLEIEGTAGTMVDILYAPYLVDNQFSHQIIDSDFHDQIILSGKLDRWEATYFKPTRYLGLFVQGHDEPVKLQNVGIRYWEYPFEPKGKIHSTDAEWVNRYMEATAKTIQVCTTDAYTDNYRERRQYAQTGYYGALGNYWLYGDYVLQRRYLLQVAQEQQANGIMPAYAPLAADDYMVIMDSNCLWIRSLRNYLLYSGDQKTVRALLPVAIKLLDLFHSYTDDLGLLNNPPYPYWLDHAVIDRQGANFCLNGHYLGALEDFAEVLDWLEASGAEVYRDRAQLLRQSLRTHLWEAEKGLFSDALIDGKRSTHFSEQANAMALAENVASTEQAQSVIGQLLEKEELNYIERSSGMTMVTPAMSYFLHKGLCEYNQIDASFALLRRRFDKMLQPQYNGTLWEEWWVNGTGRSGKYVEKTRSDAQTESAFPPALFGEYLLGVQPIEPGWSRVALTPYIHGVKNLYSKIPTPRGVLGVEWKKEENGSGTLLLDIPGAMVIVIDPTKFENLGSVPFTVNGVLAAEKEGKLLVGEGHHILRF